MFDVPYAGRSVVYLGCDVRFTSGLFLYGVACVERFIALCFGDGVSPEFVGGACILGLWGNGFAVASSANRSVICTCCNVWTGWVVFIGNIEIRYTVGLGVIVHCMLWFDYFGII